MAEAYRQRATGKVDEARAAFGDIVQRSVRAGEMPALGLGKSTGYVVLGKAAAGFSIDGIGALFFEPSTGNPVAFGPEIALHPEGPALDAPFFMTADLSIYDTTTGRKADIGGVGVAVHPDGHRAYILDDQCRVKEWDITRARTLRALGRHKPSVDAMDVIDACDARSFEGAAISANGKRLSSRWGRWSLVTGAFTSIGIRWVRSGFRPAVSPDGRYIASLRRNPKAAADALVDVHWLELRDLEQGTTVTAPTRLPVLANEAPLSFGTNPLRVCIFDYNRYAFAIPSLLLLAASADEAASSPLLDCGKRSPARPPPLPELLQRLAEHVCSVGGLLIPREHCERR
ncbi:MAG: hypothetical protein HUU21_34070 [Polyangiaceae bacterium]|nr:hypothetical protein [Polyangiaceae bacterium]